MDSLGPIRQAVTVDIGEDVGTKIRSFSQNGTRIVWIVSASGSVNNVTLRARGDNSSAGIVYEETFSILSLNTEGCELSVSLVGNGRFIDGNVTGELLAASPIQLIVGTCSRIVPAAAAPAFPGQSSATVQIPFYQFFPDGTETESTVSRGRAAIPFYQFNI